MKSSIADVFKYNLFGINRECVVVVCVHSVVMNVFVCSTDCPT